MPSARPSNEFAATPARFALDRGARELFIGAAAAGFASFSALGMSSALVLIVIHGDLGSISHFIGGLGFAAVLSIGAAFAAK